MAATTFHVGHAKVCIECEFLEIGSEDSEHQYWCNRRREWRDPAKVATTSCFDEEKAK